MDPAASIAMLASAAEPSSWALLRELGLLLLLVTLSGTYSGSETVLFSLTRTQLDRDRTSANPLRRRTVQLMDRPKQTLMTILVANTAVNVCLFAVSFVLFNRLAVHYGQWVTPVSGIASVLLVVVVGEVTPKILGVALADRLAPVAGTLVYVSSYLFGPIGRAIDALLAEPFVRVVLGRPSAAPAPEAALTTDELKALLDMNRREGVLDPIETAYLREVIDLPARRVRDVMVARVDIVAYDVDGDPDGLRELMRQTRHKKIPVYERSIDNIIGLVYAKQLFFQPDADLRSLVAPVRFVPELITCDRLLQHFRNTHSQLAIAVDEFGGIAGLVTLKDLIEEIVGEIQSADAAGRAPEVVRISDSAYEVSGGLNIRYWNEAFGLQQLPDRVATVGGLITARLGKPAEPGDEIRLRNVVLHVLQTEGRRVDRVRVQLVTDNDSSDGSSAT